MRVLVIDNYDSFVYNLVQYIGECKSRILVRRNDEVTLEEAKKLRDDIDEMKKEQDLMWDYEPLIGPQMTGYVNSGSPFTIF